MVFQAERQTVLREAVQPFKQAVDKLTHPVLEVLADLSQLETYVDSLTIELPLVDFSPLDMLPVSSPVQLSESADNGDKFSNSLLDIGYDERTSSSSQPPMHSLGGHERNPPLTPASSGSRTSTSQPPVFSFRRREHANTNRHQSASSGEQEQSLPSPSSESSAGPRSVVHNQERQTPGNKPDNKPDRNFEGRGSEISTNGGGIQPRQATELFQSAIAQLDGLASDILLTADSVTSDRRTNSRSSVPQPIQSMTSDRNGLSSHTLSAISSLAEQLLAPQATAADGGPQLNPGKTLIMESGITARKVDAVGSQPLHHETFTPSETVQWSQDLIAPPSLHHPAITLSSQAEGAALPSVLTGLEFAQPEASGIVEPKSELIGIVKPGFHPPIEASRLAMLINDVLVEQARRHGVDLS